MEIKRQKNRSCHGWDTLAALEKANAPKLDDCLLATTDRVARKRYGITDEVLEGQEVMSAKKRRRLEEIVAAAGTTLEEVTRRDAPRGGDRPGQGAAV